ncbi:NADH-dependent [FeFe] hydrogenase, group A6 [Alkaliphilus serpentinus]|uniref:2Fe-2S iron-sulfur cluster binding domain-containing protein n=1 Tax=Alkaliphilus serpentinus TaxID=1482731 RepID=A0A833HRL6_9FIRM|nr:NADH-dependent [FeFe] hydrogenase, group A6 [Alkaliphilus serpentinus]KAB3533532.1 2Fe-2S iron-sulfur cluster binding domain-containing protein [Alkaliphilus serpentinus]
MEKVSLTIDGIKVEVPSNFTVLEAARKVGVEIPSLCFLKGINEVGACRVCMVEVEGYRNIQASCVLPVAEGMSVKTNTKKLRDVRKSTLQLILSNHNRECLTCSRNRNCELQKLTEELNIDAIPFEGEKTQPVIDDLSPSIVRDNSKCILCGRCVSTCKNVQKIGILEFTNRGFNTEVAPAFNKSMGDTACIFCGQCVVACPVAALKEKEDIDRVWDALENPDTHVVVQTAPAVRAALGEEMGLPIGTRVTGKMVAALKRLGFHKVFDTNFAADVTIMEEGHEMLDRIQNNGVLPMITSCSPGWVRFCEFNYPEFLPNLSTCKSPQQMNGALIKSYYAERQKIDPKKIFVVSVMPCTSKKNEAARPELAVDGLRDVDAVITTREMAKMIKQARIDFHKLPDERFDHELSGYAGAGVIFGATGGVMEAALRTVADILEDKELAKIDYTEIRGTEGIREAELVLGGKTIKIAIAHGTANASRLLDMIKSGEKEYDFIEVMGCSGGCVTGGGQPHVAAKDKIDIDLRVERAKALYEEDQTMKERKSHKNKAVLELYENFLLKPNSHLAHKLLHTHYTVRDKY